MLKETREVNGGVQKIYRYKNNYGASVVRHSFSYGNKEGLWKLAVIKWNDDDTWDICYDTPITDDVLGYLTENAVKRYLKQIKKL
jgi:hypothetical protein